MDRANRHILEGDHQRTFFYSIFISINLVVIKQKLGKRYDGHLEYRGRSLATILEENHPRSITTDGRDQEMANVNLT